MTGTWMKNDAGRMDRSAYLQAGEGQDRLLRLAEGEGLYDPEYITTKWDVKEDKFYSGRAGVVFGSSVEVIDIYGGKMRQAHPDQNPTLTLLAPPNGSGRPGADRRSTFPRKRAVSPSPRPPSTRKKSSSCSTSSASPEGQAIERLGFEGEQYTKDGNTIKTTDKIATWYARFLVAANWQPPVQWMSDRRAGAR